MKIRTMAVLAAGGVAAALLPMGSAQAAQYTIVGSSAGPGTGVTGIGFTMQCNASYLTSPLNGVDGIVIDAGPWIGRVVTVGWNTPVPSGVGTLGINVWDGACHNARPPVYVSAGSGAIGVSVPGNARWLLIESNQKANTTVTVS